MSLFRFGGALALCGALLALAAPPAAAHHAFSAEYDIDKPITLKGKVSKVEWINPHGWVYVDVPDDKGATKTWAVEFGGPNTLLRRGFRKTDIPVGAEVEVKGYRAKNGKEQIAGTTVKLPDGRNFFAGSEGAGAPEQ
jgi:hypothetical protein